MTTQYIQENLDKPRSWHIVWTGMHAERKTKATLEDEGLIAYLPTSVVRRRWAGHSRDIRIPAIARCVFIYASQDEIANLEGRFPVFPARVIAESL